ncbi:MAG TPA: hypothetical protein VGI74_11000 [Streptosporangiaceae bacterium]
MRVRTGLCLLACCCVGLTACTADPHKGPNTTVVTPHVGRPVPPSSAQAALSREAFTPYAALGESSNDGLAPNESDFALTAACMSAAGYPNVSPNDIPIGIRIGGGMAFSQPWGNWGYLGAADAQQYGFLMPPGSALADLGIDAQPGSLPSLPSAEQSAASKCAGIVQNFSKGTESKALAGIQTIGNDIANDVLRDAAVKTATTGWVTCMTKNGYSFHQPNDVFFQEIQNVYNGGKQGPINITPGASVSNSARQAQIATAVSDSGCTQSTDLAGIYFAVQASYEQQLVNSNQQALNAAVQQYRAAYKSELKKLSAQLKTAKAQPFPKVKPKRVVH